MIVRGYHGIRNAYWSCRARATFWIRGVRWPARLRIRGPIGVSRTGNGTINIGDHVVINNDSNFNRAGINHPTQLVATNGATLTIGSHTGISGAAIYCKQRISIGNHVMLGVNCSIYDTDFHPLDYRERRNRAPAPTMPVTIEDDVWLGANCTVLKGVTVGARSVVAAGSIVTKDVPPDSLAGGVPAKVIRSLV